MVPISDTVHRRAAGATVYRRSGPTVAPEAMPSTVLYSARTRSSFASAAIQSASSMALPTCRTISGIVLAGGRSRRLGHDKRALRLWGQAGPTLLEHTVQLLVPICAELIVVLNDPTAWASLPAQLVGDQPGAAGPLGGLYAGLAAASYDTALVVAADMPLLNVELLRALIAEPSDYDALVPRSSFGLEPLHALYRRTCLAPLQAYLASGGRALNGFLTTVHVATPAPALIAHYDPQGRAFLNLNTPEDLALAQQLISADSP